MQEFQEALRDIGVTKSSVEASEPKTAIGTSTDSHTREEIVLFQSLITEAEIASVSSDLFASGYYNLSVSEAFKAIDNFVSEKAKRPRGSGTALMEEVFSPSKPKLVWTSRTTKSEDDEQKGYHRLYAGAMLGIRNPTAHEFDWVEEAETALELIVFAQHLLKKAKLAKLSK
ncbi:TIGR02391 family protein [Alphaproteobacteria bacterium GH1-50]|uniref:TIGR02391 family protein n=1 Tax=Kangsaoukella pontilimi TaxID=2691042 RepID=A0A7C9MFB1_9RHOB|nr:TIGR02391 family protein [Kangsaoukella pontilimi]